MLIKVVFCRRPANVLPGLGAGGIESTPIGIGLKRERIDVRGGLSQLALLHSFCNTIDRIDIHHMQVPDTDSQTMSLRRRRSSRKWPDRHSHPCGIRVCIYTQPSDRISSAHANDANFSRREDRLIGDGNTVGGLGGFIGFAVGLRDLGGFLTHICISTTS